jgi:hypothetical protein
MGALDASDRRGLAAQMNVRVDQLLTGFANKTVIIFRSRKWAAFLQKRSLHLRTHRVADFRLHRPRRPGLHNQ